jgi:laminin alpha 1/2
MQNVAKQAVYLSHRTKDVEEISLKVSRSLSDLRGKIAMARHAAASVKISMSNDWEEATGCVRSYRVNLTSSTSNKISLVYAVDVATDKTGLLAFLPGHGGKSEMEQRNFMAIEMVDRKIRFLWNNGAGTRSIIHNVTIETANNLRTEDHVWYRITAER